IGVMGDAKGGEAGVVGRGGPREGTGGMGVGSLGGSGGVGVHGGGGGGSPGGSPAGGGLRPGGMLKGPNTEPRLAWGGVCGVAGDAGSARAPAPSDAGSVGVFGQGADAKVDSVIDGAGMVTLSGPSEPGAGIIGRGGVPISAPPGMLMAAGVIGLAGGETKPP